MVEGNGQTHALLRLHPTTHRVRHGNRLLLASGQGPVVVDPYGDVESAVLFALADGVTQTDLARRMHDRFGDEAVERAGQVIGQLSEAGLVRPVPPAARVPERFSRTLTYLSQFASGDVGEHELLARLRSSTVAVVGVGGLGTWLCAGLACLGVGELRLLDMDTVEASNLNRSILFTDRDVGRAKLDVAKERLEASTDWTSVRLFEGDVAVGGVPPELMDGANLVLSTADRPAWTVRQVVADACVARGLPFLCPAGFEVGPLYMGPGTACVLCGMSERLDRRPGLRESLDGHPSVPPSQPGSAPHVAAAVAGVVLHDALRVLTGLGDPVTRNHVWTADWTLVATLVPRPLYEGCPACAGAR
jgi:molybdopterin/thiamine biosynthesis adenylyltransferase